MDKFYEIVTGDEKAFYINTNVVITVKPDSVLEELNKKHSDTFKMIYNI